MCRRVEVAEKLEVCQRLHSVEYQSVVQPSREWDPSVPLGGGRELLDLIRGSCEHGR